MASDIFAKIGDIKGESLDDKHKDEIDVMSFSWGLSQAGNFASGSGAGTGKVQFQDFHFTSHVNKSSPKLFIACATGEHIKEATISVRKASSDTRQDYIVIKMNDVLISSYQSSGSAGDDLPAEQVSMVFGKVEFTYYPQKPDGSRDAAVTEGWDLKANKKV